MSKSLGGIVKRLRILIPALLLFLVPSYAVSDSQYVSGEVAGFASKNYGGFVPAPGILVGEHITLGLQGPAIDRRLLRYRIGGGLTDGRSFGMAERIRLLDRKGDFALMFLPRHWYRFSLFGEVGATDVVDGPRYSWDNRHRGLGADISIRPNIDKWPGLYAKYYDYRHKGDFSFGDRQRKSRQLSVNLLHRVSPKTQYDLTYDWIRSEDEIEGGGYTRHSLYADGHSRLGTDTTLAVRAFGNWNDYGLRGGLSPSSRQLGTQAYLSHELDERNDFQATYLFNLLTGRQLYVQTNETDGIWYHQASEWLRTALGTEFAHQATDGVLEGFAYQKFREAGIAGADVHLRSGSFEFTPYYYLRLGAVQLQDGHGGLYHSHTSAVPIFTDAVEPLPMSLTANARVEVDNSAVPIYSFYRDLTYRADFYSVGTESGSIVTNAYLIAKKSRTDREIEGLGSRVDTTSLSVLDSTDLKQLYTRFSVGYSVSQSEVRQSETTTHVFTGQLDWYPTPSFNWSNMVQYSKTFFEVGSNGRAQYRSDVTYRWRRLDMGAGIRYDDSLRGTGEWGFYAEIRRSFGFGV